MRLVTNFTSKQEKHCMLPDMSDSFFKGSLLAFSFCKDGRIQSSYIASDWRQHQNRQCQVCGVRVVWNPHALQQSGTQVSHKKRKKMQTRTNFKTPNQRVWNAAQNSRSSASLGAGVGGKRSVHVCVGGCASSLRSQSRGWAFDGWAWHEHIYNGHVAAGRQQTRLPNDPGPKNLNGSDSLLCGQTNLCRSPSSRHPPFTDPLECSHLCLKSRICFPAFTQMCKNVFVIEVWRLIDNPLVIQSIVYTPANGLQDVGDDQSGFQGQA